MDSLVVYEAHLAYKDAHSDKVYHITMERETMSTFAKYRVMVKFGPRLGTLTHVDLTKGWTTHPEALRLYNKRLNEKIAKGYAPITQPNPERDALKHRINMCSRLPYFSQDTLNALADFILEYVEERV